MLLPSFVTLCCFRRLIKTLTLLNIDKRILYGIMLFVVLSVYYKCVFAGIYPAS